VAGTANTRAALDDVRALAEPSPGLTALQSKYDAHEASIENLLQAEWRYQRGEPWNEPNLLYKMIWDMNEVLVHHARQEKRAEALECPPASQVPSLEDASARLGERLQTQRMLAESVGGQFDGYDLHAQGAEPANSPTMMQVLAGLLALLAITAVTALVFAVRKRSRTILDALMAVAVLVLAGLAGWLLLGAASEQERLRATLFDSAAVVYRETLDLNESLKALTLLPRGGVLPQRDTADRLIADYAEYTNSLSELATLVRVWDRAVLTGTFDTGLISSQPIQSHDGLLDAIRSRALALYRRYAQLDRRIADLSCRSQWFPRTDGRTREDELLAMPEL
jgi:hypothetical protein